MAGWAVTDARKRCLQSGKVLRARACLQKTFWKARLEPPLHVSLGDGLPPRAPLHLHGVSPDLAKKATDRDGLSERSERSHGVGRAGETECAATPPWGAARLERQRVARRVIELLRIVCEDLPGGAVLCPRTRARFPVAKRGQGLGASADARSGERVWKQL